RRSWAPNRSLVPEYLEAVAPNGISCWPYLPKNNRGHFLMRRTRDEIERPAPRIERLRSLSAAVGHPSFLSRPIAQDALLAGSLTATSLVGVLVDLHVDLPEGGEEATIRSLDAFGLLLILLQTVPLTWRRRAPIPVLAVTMSALFVYSVN